MKESARAAQAWADYLAMGPGRSLDELCRRYSNATIPTPTKRVKTLKDWSVAFGWQDRLRAISEQEARLVSERESQARAELQSSGIANRQNRIDALNDRWLKMQQVITERANDPLVQNVPGGTTGLIVPKPMLVKVYDAGGEESDTLHPTKESEMSYEYAVDTGLLKEMRETEKQAAQEMGQWSEKRELTGKDGGPIEITDAREQLITRIAAITERIRPVGSPVETQ